MAIKRKTKAGEPIPATLERSPKKAADTYVETLASAEESYGDEAAAHRVAWGAVKKGFEKVGDHWEAKDERGPSDERAKRGGPGTRGKSYGGVDIIGNTKDQLREQARTIGAEVTTKMTKAQLATAIQHANQRADRAARKKH